MITLINFHGIESASAVNMLREITQSMDTQETRHQKHMDNTYVCIIVKHKLSDCILIKIAPSCSNNDEIVCEVSGRSSLPP